MYRFSCWLCAIICSSLTVLGASDHLCLGLLRPKADNGFCAKIPTLPSRKFITRLPVGTSINQPNLNGSVHVDPRALRAYYGESKVGMVDLVGRNSAWNVIIRRKSDKGLVRYCKRRTLCRNPEEFDEGKQRCRHHCRCCRQEHRHSVPDISRDL